MPRVIASLSHRRRPNDAPQLHGVVCDRKVAVGGMAEIWLARVGEDRVAVKRLLPHLAADDEFVSLVREEARVWASLDHAAIVRLRETQTDATGHFVLVLDWVTGASLEAIVAEAALGVDEALAVAAEVAGALDYLHRAAPLAPVVHRDIAPANVLVDVGGRVRLTDFGLAYVRERVIHTRSGELRGRLRALSPERLAGSVPHRADDMYALAIMLCDLIAPVRHGGEPAEVGALLAATRVRSERVAAVAERLLHAAAQARDLRGQGASPVLLRSIVETSPRIERERVAAMLAERARRVVEGAADVAVPTRTPLLIE